jgi:hypothetical protein
MLRRGVVETDVMKTGGGGGVPEVSVEGEVMVLGLGDQGRAPNRFLISIVVISLTIPIPASSAGIVTAAAAVVPVLTSRTVWVQQIIVC